MTTKCPTNATFLAHTTHAARQKRDDSCRICADNGAVRVTWDEFKLAYPEWNAR